MAAANPSQKPISTKTLVIIAAIILLIITIFLSAYILKPDEQSVVLRFGDPVNTEQEAGLYFKVPFIDEVKTYPKKILTRDYSLNENIKTHDDVRILMDFTVRWRITDPVVFIQELKDVETAESKLDGFIDSAIAENVTRYTLVSIVRSDTSRRIIEEILAREQRFSSMEVEEIEEDATGEVDEAMSIESLTSEIRYGREDLQREIQQAIIYKLSEQNYGIELVQFFIKRVNYTGNVRDWVYTQMRKEREVIAKLYRAQGESEAKRILGRLEREKLMWESFANKTARKILGKADALAAELYNRTYSRNPAFYNFYKKLETYQDTITENTILMLTTNSDYLDYLTDVQLPHETPGGRVPSGVPELTLEDLNVEEGAFQSYVEDIQKLPDYEAVATELLSTSAEGIFDDLGITLPEEEIEAIPEEETDVAIDETQAENEPDTADPDVETTPEEAPEE